MEAARVATVDDLAALASLCRQGLAELAAQDRGGPLFVAREARAEPVEDSLGAAFGDPEAIIVAGTFSQVVVGYGTGRLEKLANGSTLGVIDDLFVESGARGVGVGEAMMSQLLAWFTERGCQGVDAVALPGMRASKNFFETAGFTGRLIVMHHRMRQDEAVRPQAGSQ